MEWNLININHYMVRVQAMKNVHIMLEISSNSGEAESELICRNN